MSTYLLLRNNKESGPFTIEEIKGMSLKAYDLLWVVGKSAAWRYPGEINELKSFAPPVPEQPNDALFRKYAPGNAVTESPVGISKENNSKYSNSHSVYVNMPGEKKQSDIFSERVMPQSNLVPDIQRSENSFSGIYKKQPSSAARFSGRILWISTIVLLFGAGILTGLFISDRREFFSADEKRPQHLTPVQTVISNNQKPEASPLQTSYQQQVVLRDSLVDKYSPSANPSRVTPLAHSAKKKISTVKKDSSASQTAALASFTRIDSNLNPVGKPDALYQNIKAHPENYINLVTGHYSTGILGGISSFPVTITNNSPVVMDEVTIKIDYIQTNDKLFKSEILSFNDLQPGETVSIKAPKSSRGTKISAVIHTVASRKIDLSYSH